MHAGRSRREQLRLAVILSLFAVLIGVAVALSPTVGEWDVRAVAAVASWRCDAMTWVMRDITSLGSTPVLLLALGITAAATWRRTRLVSVQLLVIAVGAIVVDTLGKLILNRPRPPAMLHLVATHSPSFPSGHASTTAAVAITIALIIGRLTPDNLRARLALVTAVLVVTLVSLSRVYLGVHHPTDVVAGACLGGSLALIVDVVFTRWPKA